MMDTISQSQRPSRQSALGDSRIKNEFDRKLMHIKQAVEDQLRSDYDKKTIKLMIAVNEERADIARIKSDLNVKARQFKDSKAALIKEAIAREAAYIEAIDSLRLALSEKDEQAQMQEECVAELLSAKQRLEEKGSDRKDSEPCIGRTQEEPSAPSDLNSQKLKDLEYRAKFSKEDVNLHKRELTPNFFRTIDYAEKSMPKPEQPKQSCYVAQQLTYPQDEDNEEVSFEIRHTNDCTIYAQSCIDRELRLLRQEYIDRGEELPQSLSDSRKNYSPHKRATDGDLLTYSLTNRISVPHENVNLTTSQSDRKTSQHSHTAQYQGKSEHQRVTDESFNQVDEALRCKGLLELILLEQPLDDKKTQKIKENRSKYLRESIKDDLLAPRVQAMISILSKKHDSQSSTLQEYSRYFGKLISILDSLNADIYESYASRLSQLNKLDSCADVYDSIKHAKAAVERLRQLKTADLELTKLVSKRYKLRVELEICSQEFDRLDKISYFNRATSSLYTLLRSTNKQILAKMHHRPAVAYRYPAAFKGQPLIELISMDFWEEEYLRKLEGRFKSLHAHACK